MSKSKVYLSLDDLHKLYGISPEVIRQIKKKRKKRKKRKQLKDSKKQLASEIKSTNEQMKGYSMSRNNALEEMKIESHLKSIENQNKRFEQPLLINDDFALTPEEMVFAQQMKEGIKKGEIKYNPTKTGLSLLKPTLKKPRGKYAKEVFFDDEVQKSNPLAGQGSSSMLREDPNTNSVFNFVDDGFDKPVTQGSDFFVGTSDDTIYPIQNNPNESVLLGDDELPEIQLDSQELAGQELAGQGFEEGFDEEEEDDEEPAAAEFYAPKTINKYHKDDLKIIAKQNNINIKKFNKQQIYDELYNLRLL